MARLLNLAQTGITNRATEPTTTERRSSMTYYTCILCRTQGYDDPWVGDFDATAWVGGCPQCDLSQGIMPLGEVESADLTDARRVIESGKVDRLDEDEEMPTLSESDIVPRKPGCVCHLEEGDSPCPVHGMEEA
jgi:hypothetical protein